MNGRGAILRGGTAAAAAVALAFAAGCGGGERQDAGVTAATYTVAEPVVTFPAKQELAEESELRIAVRNVGRDEIPNLAVTIEADREGTRAAAFGALSEQPGIKSRSRPVWILEDTTGMTAFANTWALGPVAPGATQTFSWRLSAIRAGRWSVDWRLAGALGNKARVVQADGRAASGSLTVDISRKPGQARVDENGDVVRVSGRDFDESSR
ncbi:hypothetical protein [Conexibacter arvalis]|uniref:Uncharacterized protein n=1 Tax=Conexibacter arvalis TaxID=912552 RepID=A0A840IEQ2_9ACTN|nr:hypothetical protein [Conexibacter arvalis]MBB4662683.1 hypothetical protein [Conexibacter arvalis]